ncbi:hypothetical protein ABW06_22715 [Pluralibacter gergoviae]|uniref:Uncharacterized protein n=2 Tax=Pluralibacter gergoviae TaxID=61647 RepID=A0A0J5KXA7_PLUGE|nr:hypothetical protein ABW06_22715 [Pluralibacter gergoviae]
MDSRAAFDTEDATIFEALGRKLPTNRNLKRDWGDMGAYLVRAPVISNTACGDFEVIRQI